MQQAKDESPPDDEHRITEEDRKGARDVMHRISILLTIMAINGMSTTALYNGVLHALIAFDLSTLCDGCKSELPAVLRAFADEMDTGNFALQYLKPKGEA